MPKDRQCPVPGCPVMLDRAVFACRRHWYMIPVRLRRNVSVAYGAWSTDPLDAHLIDELEDAQADALAAITP